MIDAIRALGPVAIVLGWMWAVSFIVLSLPKVCRYNPNQWRKWP
jgi:hypothetical protein